MQKAGICYKGNSKKDKVEKILDLGLRPKSRHNLGIVLHQFPSERKRSSPGRYLSRRLPALFNRCFETRQKHLARSASVEVLFQLLTQRVIELLIKVVREFSEHGLTACRVGLAGRGARRHDGASSAHGPWFPRFHK